MTARIRTLVRPRRRLCIQTVAASSAIALTLLGSASAGAASKWWSEKTVRAHFLAAVRQELNADPSLQEVKTVEAGLKNLAAHTRGFLHKDIVAAESATARLVKAYAAGEVSKVKGLGYKQGVAVINVAADLGVSATVEKESEAIATTTTTTTVPPTTTTTAAPSLFTVTGSGPALITIDAAGNEVQYNDVSLPWSGNGPPGFGDRIIEAQTDSGASDASITCTINLGQGFEPTTNTSTGPYSIATCNDE